MFFNVYIAYFINLINSWYLLDEYVLLSLASQILSLVNL